MPHRRRSQFTYLARAVQALDAPLGRAACVDFTQNDFKLVVGVSCLHILYRSGEPQRRLVGMSALSSNYVTVAIHTRVFVGLGGAEAEAAGAVDDVGGSTT